MMLLAESFDGIATADLNSRGWSAVGTNANITSAGGRRGTQYLSCSPSSGNRKLLPASYSTLITGMATLVTFGRDAWAVMRYVDSGNYQCGLSINTNGSISLMRGVNTATIATSPAGVCPVGVWFYLEFKATIHGTAGVYEVRVNNVNVLSGSGVDLNLSANNSANAIEFSSASIGFDDVVVCDTSGPDNNDFLGDIAIDVYRPNSDGTYSQFTPSTGTSHYALVDETTPNSTDYNSSATVGQKDTYNFTNLSGNTGTIKGVQVNLYAQKDDAGGRTVAPIIKSGATEDTGTAVALVTTPSWQVISEIWETDPNTSAAWTTSGVNAAEFGATVAA